MLHFFWRTPSDMALLEIAKETGVELGPTEDYEALWKKCHKNGIEDILQDSQDDYWAKAIDTAVQSLFAAWKAHAELHGAAEISVSWVDLYLLNKDEGGDCSIHYSFSERFCDFIKTLTSTTTKKQIREAFVREKESIKTTIAFYPMNRVLLEMVKELNNQI